MDDKEKDLVVEKNIIIPKLEKVGPELRKRMLSDPISNSSTLMTGITAKQASVAITMFINFMQCEGAWPVF